MSNSITEVDEFNMDRFQIFPPTEIADRLTVKYALLELNIARYYSLLERAEILEQELEEYLEEIE